MEISDAEIIAPIEIEKFFSQYWEKQHLHIQRQNTKYFAGMVSTDVIETLLSSQDLYFPSVQVVQADKTIAVSDYTDKQRKIVPKQLIGKYAEGATLIFSQAHRKILELADLCRSNERFFNMRCQANLYLSPPGNQGFNSHYDTHDVFILQVSGKKTFRIYQSDYELPFTEEDYDPALNVHDEILEEIHLAAGDTLYLPRGLVHDAIAQEDGPSLHITLGVYPIVVRDLLQNMIQVAAENDANLRTTIHLVQEHKNRDVNALENLLSTVATQEIIEEALSRIADERAIESLPSCQSMLTIDSISLESRIAVVNSSVLNYERRAGTLKLRTTGQVLMFEDPMGSAVEYLLNHGSISVRSLPNLTPEQQIALCDHLLGACAIKIVGSP